MQKLHRSKPYQSSLYLQRWRGSPVSTPALPRARFAAPYPSVPQILLKASLNRHCAIVLVYVSSKAPPRVCPAFARSNPYGPLRALYPSIPQILLEASLNPLLVSSVYTNPNNGQQGVHKPFLPHNPIEALQSPSRPRSPVSGCL